MIDINRFFNARYFNMLCVYCQAVNRIGTSIGIKIIIVLLAIIVHLYSASRVRSVKVRQLWRGNEFSADNLDIFDLCKILNRVILFHVIRGYRRLLKILSSKRFLAFRECCL